MSKKHLSFFVFIISYCLGAAQVTITKSGGWYEAAFVEWTPLSGADSYNVYVSGQSLSNIKLDNPLIRSYGSYLRADAIGLTAGTYTLKVVPVVAGKEQTASTTGSLSVIAHDRSGFAFSNGRIPGAYKADGSPKDGAVIVYVSEGTKNTVSLEVTGATANPCVGLQNILDGFKKGKDTRPLIIRMIGQITDLTYMLGGDIVIENNNTVNSYITLEGVGKDAVADGWGIRLKNASNIEVRNIGTMNCNSDEGDNIGLQQTNDYIWVHNCDLFYGNAGSDADQVKGDGSLDCKKSTYVTFSYNHFWDSGKCNLLGLSEGTTDGLYITYHHNWYDHSDSRHPRVRYYSAHVYNNYYDGNSKYGAGSTLGSSVFMEANYFRHCKYPMLTSLQGSDVYNETTGTNDYVNLGTFSGEDGGSIKAFNNYMEGEKRFVPYGAAAYPNATVDFDAYVVSNRTQTVPNTVKSAYGANVYNNFDTNTSLMYGYTPDAPAAAKTQVIQYAGRMNGGDLTHTFDNAVDDESSLVNTVLKAKLSTYKTGLVSIQGLVTVPVDSTGGDTTVVNPSDMIHNFTASGSSSTFYTITGALSTSKGTVSYAGLTLTQCLKMESATNIAFTSTETGNLTLVFNSTFTGSVMVDGTSKQVTNGILTTSLNAGAHSITKGDATNLYYIQLEYIPLAINDQLENMEIHAYPNPIKNKLELSSNEIMEKLELFDLNGALQGRFVAGHSSETLYLNDLRAGTYLLKIHTSSGIKNKLIVKAE